ncbi:MAG: hypothetical protein J5894_02230 [Clostridia bacterium]|nr:hypothetical protein [Clostridia bacterium]
MELTSTQKLLMNGLELFGVEKDAMIVILISLQEEEKMRELMNYMAENQQANQEDILEQMVRIKNQN